MNTLQTVVLSGHTVIALLIIILVLLQRGKGADAGAAFGAGASGTVFGARGSSSFFSRATAVLATAFFISSLALAYMSSQHSTAPDSLIEGAPEIELQEPESDDNVDAVPDMPQLENDTVPEGTDDMPSLQDEAPSTSDDESQ
jgi:preprotein translocase subunit SecG